MKVERLVTFLSLYIHLSLSLSDVQNLAAAIFKGESLHLKTLRMGTNLIIQEKSLNTAIAAKDFFFFCAIAVLIIIIISCNGLAAYIPH